MNDAARNRYLSIALIVSGTIFLLGVYPLMMFWPAGWQWSPNQSEYEQMLVGVYAVLGLFLIIAARDPARHVSLIWFTIVSSAVHAVIMAVQAFGDASERGHLWGDVPALLLIAAVLAWLAPRGSRGVV